MPLKIYTLAQCSTCRKATQWLRSRGIAFNEQPIRETPPSEAELGTMIAAKGGDLRKLSNTGSQDYRDAKLSERVAQLSADDAVSLWRRNGNLVKRPFVLGEGVALVGFKEPEWEKAFDRG